MDTVPIKTILEEAEEKDLATGLVSTSSITHATPASFIAHQASRNSYEAIAADFLKTDIDVFIGGGYDNFANREDGKNLVKKLEEKGYKIATKLAMADTFWPAEDYHQDYYDKNKKMPYCHGYTKRF